MAWYTHLFKNFPQFIMIHTVKGFDIVHKAEVNVFLEFPNFLYDPETVGNLISSSSSFSKPNLNIWKFLVCIMLKPSMQGFKHDLTSMEGFPGSSDSKTSACNAGDLGLIPGSGRSPGEGNGNLLQYSCLENSMDGGYSPWDHKESDTTEQLCWWLLAWEMSAIV